MKIIDNTKGVTVTEVADLFKMSRANMYNNPELSVDKVDLFVKKYFTEIEKAGFEVVDNYDAYGYKGKAIVERGAVLYGGKFIEVTGHEDKDDANSGLQDQDPNTFLESISKRQKDLAADIDAFLKGSLGHPSKSGSRSKDVKDRRRRLHDTQGGKDNSSREKETEP